MMLAGGVVLALNQNLSTDLLGGVAVLGGIAVIVNAVLDLTDNGGLGRRDYSKERGDHGPER